jgi:hypothetical protein
MKLVFLRAIPEFQGKTWQQRSDLRQDACKLDRRIFIRRILINLSYAPLLSCLMLLRQQQILHSLIWVAIFYFAVGLPFVMLCHALWVNPLIRDAIRIQRA